MTNPSTLIFLGLAVVWAIVLLPEVVKRVSKMRRADSIRSFNHQLLALDRSGPMAGGVEGNRRGTRALDRSVPNPLAASRPGVGGSNVIDLRSSQRVTNVPVPPAVRRRRQEVTAALAAGVVVTLLCLVAFGPVFILPQLLADGLLGAYLYLVAQANRNAAMVGSAARTLRSDSAMDRVGRDPVVRVRPVSTGTEPVAATR